MTRRLLITFQPSSSPEPQTLIMPGATAADFEALEARRHGDPDAVIGVPCQVTPDGPVRERLLRAGAITAVRWDEPLPAVCDNTSVGVIVTDGHGKYLLFDRNTFPPGAAPPAGHVDDHGTYEDAARAEVAEETGLTVVTLEYVTGGWQQGRCRRQPGPRGAGHEWRVYSATVTGTLDPSPRETRNARWLDAAGIQALAGRTARWQAGQVTDAEFEATPGLEPVWVRWLTDAGLVTS